MSKQSIEIQRADCGRTALVPWLIMVLLYMMLGAAGCNSASTSNDTSSYSQDDMIGDLIGISIAPQEMREETIAFLRNGLLKNPGQFLDERSVSPEEFFQDYWFYMIGSEQDQVYQNADSDTRKGIDKIVEFYQGATDTSWPEE